MEKLRQRFSQYWPEHRQTILTLFIVFNIVAIVIGCTRIFRIPAEIRQVFFPYLRWTRLAQSWYLFAPEPKREAVRYRVEIVFRDGTRKEWYRPYPDNWDFFNRHLAYQFQKFDLGSNYLLKDPEARKDYCNYVLRLYHNNDNPAESVSLYKEFAPWPAPVEGRELVYDEKQLYFTDFLVATYKVYNGQIQ